MRSVLASTILAALLITGIAPASASTEGCVRAGLLERWGDRMNQYGTELAEEGLMVRFWTKKREQEEPPPPDAKWLGTLIPFRPDPTYRWYLHLWDETTQFLPRRISQRVRKDGVPHEFHPLARAYDVVEKAALKDRTLTKPTRLIVGLGLAQFSLPFVIHDWITNKKDQLDDQKKLADVDALIDSDFRFEGIHQKLWANGKPTPEARDKAREDATRLLAAYQEYYRSMEELHKKGLRPDSEEATYLMVVDPRYSKIVEPLFRDVHVLNSPAFWNNPNFVYHQGKVVTPEQLVKVTSIVHARLAMTAKIPQWLGNEALWRAAWHSVYSGLPAEEKEARDRLRSDPFTKELLDDEKRGLISRNEVMYYLMKDFEWRGRLQEWKILGIEWRPGGVTATIEDAREDIRNEIRSRRPR